MSWEHLTLADVRRLVAAIEQANPQAVRAIIDRAPVDNGEHSRVTLGMLINLLNQLGGRTVLSNEDIQLLNRPDEPAIVQPTFAKLLAACNQDIVDSEFTEANFPLVNDGTFNQVEECFIGKSIALSEALSWIDQHGFIPVGIRRAMEWVAANQNQQFNHPVVVIGARSRSDAVTIPVLVVSENDVKRRKLAVSRFSDDVRLASNDSFLVCRK